MVDLSNNVYFCGNVSSSNSIVMGYCVTGTGNVYQIGGFVLNPASGAGSLNISGGVTNNANSLAAGTSVSVQLPDTFVSVVTNPGNAGVEVTLGTGDATGTLAVTQGTYIGTVSSLANQGYAWINNEITTLTQDVNNAEQDVSDTINAGIAAYNTAVQVVGVVESAVSTVESFLNGGSADNYQPIFTPTTTDVDAPSIGSSTAAISGSSEPIAVGSNGTAAITGTANTISAGSNSYVTANGSGDNFTFNTGAAAGISGGSEIVHATTNDDIYLTATGSATDTIYANGDHFGGTSVNGTNTTGIWVNSNTLANIGGSNNGVSCGSGAAVGVNGGANTIDGTSASDIYVTGTGSSIDTVQVSSDGFGSTTENGANTSGIWIANNSQVTVVGNSNGVSCGAGSDVGISGGGNLIDGTDATDIYATGTGSTIDTINVSGDEFGAATDKGANTSGVWMNNNSQATIIGSNDGIYAGTGSALGISGGANTVDGYANTDIYLTGTNGATDAVDVNNDVFGGTTDKGANTSGVWLSNNSIANIIGNDNGIYGGGGDTAGIIGTSDSLTISSSTVDVGGSAEGVRITGSSDAVDVFYKETGDTIYASNETIRLASDVQANVEGNNDHILGSTGDNILVQGTYDPVSADDSTINYSGADTGDYVDGSGDSGSDWAGTDGSSGGGSGLGTTFWTSGVAAGIARKMNTVAQYDLSHGFADAATESNVAWMRTQAAVAHAKDPTLPQASPFNGIKWSGKTITWSFAAAQGPSASPFSSYIQQQYQATIEQALAAWSAATGLTFQQVSDSSSANIRIGWGDFQTSESGTVGMMNATHGTKGTVDAVIIRLEDPGETSLITGTSSALTYSGTQTSLYQAALHEVGHALGLGENSDPNSIMYPLLNANNLNPDTSDLANLQSLYGTSPSIAAQSNQFIQAMASSSMAAFMGAETSSTHTTSPTALAANPLLHGMLSH